MVFAGFCINISVASVLYQKAASIEIFQTSFITQNGFDMYLFMNFLKDANVASAKNE